MFRPYLATRYTGQPEPTPYSREMAIAFASALPTIDKETLSTVKRTITKDPEAIIHQYRLLFAPNGCSDDGDVDQLIPVSSLALRFRENLHQDFPRYVCCRFVVVFHCCQRQNR
jgi:hypothetical protein